MEDQEVWLLPLVGRDLELNRDTQDLGTEASWAVWTGTWPLSIRSHIHYTVGDYGERRNMTDIVLQRHLNFHLCTLASTSPSRMTDSRNMK